MTMPGWTAELSLSISTGPGVAAAELSLPIYGNFCGPGHGDMSNDPIDAVDAVCKAHDSCYDSRGYFNCSCDRELIASMPRAILDTPSAGGKLAGAAAMAFFASVPCTCPLRICLPIIGCHTIPVPGHGGIGVC
jgi:hypothetical protein